MAEQATTSINTDAPHLFDSDSDSDVYLETSAGAKDTSGGATFFQSSHGPTSDHDISAILKQCHLSIPEIGPPTQHAETSHFEAPIPDKAAPTNHVETTQFEALVEALRDKLGPSSGISDHDVMTDELKALMENYTSNESDWEKYAFKAPSKLYTRNLVDKGNGKSNLLILVWSPGKGSPVHDHANAHCIMKILRGQLTETLYSWPTVQLNTGERRPLQVTKETIFNTNEVTYMSDKLGLHKISNPDPNQYAVSLHLYTPPNAAVYGCHTFNERTGEPSHQKTCTVYSEYGRRTKL